MMERLVQLLAATAELLGSELSGVALAVLAKDLSVYDMNVIERALENVRRNQTRFNQAAIQKEIELLLPDGRPGVEEAWAMWPHDESVSAVITDEMAEAMTIAGPLLADGDKIGARMAFKEAYTRLVNEAKANKNPVRWFASLGHEKEGREAVLKEAVRLGRLSQDHAQSLLPSPKEGGFVAGLLGDMKLLTKSDEVLTDEQKEKNRKHIAKIKNMLKKAA
jgi:hypothetical protein